MNDKCGTYQPAPEIGTVAVWQRRMYVYGAPGWLQIAGARNGDDYAHWTEELGPDAVTIREGI